MTPVFHDANPSEPFIHMLKYFEYGLYFKEIYECSKTQQCHWYCRFNLLSPIGTAKSISTVSLILWSQAHWCLWHRGRGVKPLGVFDTGESSSLVSLKPGVKLLGVFDTGESSSLVSGTGESSFLVSLTLQSLTHWGVFMTWRSQSCFLSWPLIAFKGIIT